MKLITKAFFIILLLFVARTLTGCFNYPCSEEVYYFDFAKVSTKNLDNSGMWPTISQTDTMKRSSVAFQVNVAGDFSYLGQQEQEVQGIGFQTAKAFAKTDCPMLYGAENSIENISITTLFNINKSILANSDVSDLFVSTDQTNYNSALYIPLNQLYPIINHVYVDYPEVKFQVFLKSKVEADSARFVINIKLADNSVLSDTTKLIFIK